MCQLYAVHGVDLGDLRLVGESDKAEMAGQIVVAPPSALNDRWSRRLPDPVTARASGWMRVRQRARQRMVALPLVVSDPADWDEMTATLAEVNTREQGITPGIEAGVRRWCQRTPRHAGALHPRC